MSEDLKQEEQRAKLELNQERDDLRKILALPEGKRFLWRLFEFTGLYRNPYSGDKSSTEFNCGLQSVGQFLLDEAIDANPEAIAEIIIKNKTREKL